MKIRKDELIGAYAQSIGIKTAIELIDKKIEASSLENKKSYTGEEVARICNELANEEGLIRIIAQSLLVQLERKKAEEQALLLDNIETHVWYLTDAETYGAVNSARADFLGMKKEDLEDKKLWNIVSKEEAKACIACNKKVFQEKKQIQAEQWLKNSKGEVRTLSVVTTPKLDDNGNVEYLICTAHDITKRKRAEKEKKKLEARLRQAEKMQAIGTLAGGIAHDFNNILGVIMGYTELTLLDVPEGTKMYSNLDQVLKASERARDLVKQILAFSRQSEQEREPVQLGSIVKEALKMLRRSLPTTIDIRQNIEKESGTVLADAIQIHQVLMNLCTNAAHAMGDTGGVLNVGLSDVDLDIDAAANFPGLKPGPYVRLTVSDTGHGIDGSILERIFDPFFTTKDKGKGTGMGLAVVHGIVKSYSGAITVYSEPEQGTTFHVYFPRSERLIGSCTWNGGPLPEGKEEILFVDDEKQLVNMGKQMLERLGYHVTPCTSSVEAIEAFRAQPQKFDLVITDQTMPNMTGLELAKKLMEVRLDIPVILCTGFSEVILKEKNKAVNIRKILMKPIVAHDLAVTIRKVLDKKLNG
ncbi:MAG: ATP-binding protein [Deltaproteobacteria bacterium]|jgi:PAS domain S-box-containing protein|nr:ATP-binding protein [Deltaproteobacteria bacterium]MDL1987806.1 ATP-binding protein [Deltaproteobacteria bacterium]MDL2123590.1 ATP-binding protein [Deltaproteobacteria bacterium]